VLHWQFDGTPQRIAFQLPATTASLAAAGDPLSERQDKYGIRDVLVQKGFFATACVSDNVFAKPLVLADQTSLTHLHAILKEQGDMGLDLQTLSSRFERVLLSFGADGAATCDLVVDYVKCLVEALGNVVVQDAASCLMHSLNRISADHIVGSNFKLNALFSLTKLMYIGA
jgi:hypothetical protein